MSDLLCVLKIYVWNIANTRFCDRQFFTYVKYYGICIEWMLNTMDLDLLFGKSLVGRFHSQPFFFRVICTQISNDDVYS